MSFIGLKVPTETARLLWDFWESSYENYGAAVPRDHAHITILDLGEDVPIEQLEHAIGAAYAVTSKTPPFSVSTNRISVFPPNDSGRVAIICPIDSLSLHDLRRRLCESFDQAGIPYSKKFPEYRPHVTLAFSEDPSVHSQWGTDPDFSRVEWGAHEVTLWGGDHGDERLTVNFPFALGHDSLRSAVRQVLAKELCPSQHCLPRR